MDELLELLKTWHNEYLQRNNGTTSKTIEYNVVTYMYDVLLPEVRNTDFLDVLINLYWFLSPLKDGRRHWSE